jgi:hypothetical protein
MLRALPLGRCSGRLYLVAQIARSGSTFPAASTLQSTPVADTVVTHSVCDRSAKG